MSLASSLRKETSTQKGFSMAKKGRQKFTEIWANQTDLGKQFGLSAIAMGKKLKELGLRDEDGNPTTLALGNGYCTPTPLKDGTPFFLWNRQQVEELMQAQGYQRLDPQEVKAREWRRAGCRFTSNGRRRSTVSKRSSSWRRHGTSRGKSGAGS